MALPAKPGKGGETPGAGSRDFQATNLSRSRESAHQRGSTHADGIPRGRSAPETLRPRSAQTLEHRDRLVCLQQKSTKPAHQTESRTWTRI